MQVRAYGVFAGGGVKGAALAGCLAAAEDQGIEFLGYGGTSAGSMVAFLASIGMSGKEIGDALRNKSFVDFFNDAATKLKAAQTCLERLRHGGSIRKCRAYRQLNSLFGNDIGLYDGRPVIDYLWTFAKSHLASLPEDPLELRFTDLLKPLKVVATDISRRRAAVFPRDCSVYGDSVLAAVQASSGYPFVFRPLKAAGAYLADGGIASNLPSFLFASESQCSRAPTLAFDIVAAEGPMQDIKSIVELGEMVLATCLEASDELLRRSSSSIVHIPIETPPHIDTFSVQISESDRSALYNAGYAHATSFLSGLEPLKLSRRAGADIQQQLQAIYGDRRLFDTILFALREDVQNKTAAKVVRANIMLPTGRGSRIVVYHIGMDGDGDRELEIEEDAGCSGTAWTSHDPCYADLTFAAADPKAWKMTSQQHSRVPLNRKAMVSVPIFGKANGLATATTGKSVPIGTLSIDSITLLADTGWVDANGVKAHLVDRLSTWAEVIARVFP